MFLIERLFGVGVYALVLVAVCYYIKGLTDYKKIKKTLTIYAVLLAAMGFFYVPYETSDLYRIYEYIEYFGKFSFVNLWEQKLWNSDVEISAIYYWAIGKTGVVQLLPFVNALICYGCIFYIIYNYAKKNNISGKNIAIALLFYMSSGNFIFVISGIRCMLGVSLLSFCFFRESIEKKFSVLHIPMYLIAALIHPFAAVLIALRFVIPILDSKIPMWNRVLLLGGFGLGGVIVLKYFSNYISKIFDKAESYLSGDLYSYFWEYAIAILTVIIVAMAIYEFYKMTRLETSSLNSWKLYVVFSMLIAICLCFEFTIFHRLTTYITPIIVLPILMSVLQKNEETTSVENVKLPIMDRPITISSCVVVLSIITLLIACARGSLCSLKFFEL